MGPLSGGQACCSRGGCSGWWVAGPVTPTVLFWPLSTPGFWSRLHSAFTSLWGTPALHTSPGEMAEKHKAPTAASRVWEERGTRDPARPGWGFEHSWGSFAACFLPRAGLVLPPTITCCSGPGRARGLPRTQWGAGAHRGFTLGLWHAGQTERRLCGKMAGQGVSRQQEELWPSERTGWA